MDGTSAGAAPKPRRLTRPSSWFGAGTWPRALTSSSRGGTLPQVHGEGLRRCLDHPAFDRLAAQFDVSLEPMAPAEAVIAPVHLEHVDRLRSQGSHPRRVVAMGPHRFSRGNAFDTSPRRLTENLSNVNHFDFWSRRTPATLEVRDARVPARTCNPISSMDAINHATFSWSFARVFPRGRMICATGSVRNDRRSSSFTLCGDGSTFRMGSGVPTSDASPSPSRLASEAEDAAAAAAVGATGAPRP